MHFQKRKTKDNSYGLSAGDLVTMIIDPYISCVPDYLNPEAILLCENDIATIVAYDRRVSPLVCIFSKRGYGWCHPNLLEKI